MYATMVSTTGNAQLLLDRDPADVRREDAEGGDTARDQMARACGWLAEARVTCNTPQASDDVFLGCARSAARYLVKVRDAAASTGHFDSWVFKKSSPPDAGAAHDRTVISAVVPALETCMSVRAPADTAEGISRGFWRIGPATPMPLTNRLHCVTGARAVPLPGRAPRLGDWDFLKAPPSDLAALSDSLEMDAYCEVASVQDDSRQRLAAPVVLPGTVEELDDSTVTLKGLVGGEEVVALRQGGSPPPPDGLPRGGEARGAPGKRGRFLVVAWYQPRRRAPSSGPTRTVYPELLHFEECGQDEAVLDDLIGHVRMRGRAGAGGLADRYGGGYRSIASRAARLTVDCEGAVEYGHAGGRTGGSPVREFFGAVAAMRSAWSRHRAGEGLPVAARDVASGERADIASLVSWMGRSGGGADRRNLLADIQHEFDLTGYWRGELDGGGASSGRRGMPYIADGLERQGLLSCDGGVISVTDMGRRVLGAALGPDAERYVSGRDILYLPEVESRIPASVLLRRLKDGGDFARAKGPDGRRNALLWVRMGADTAEDQKRYDAALAGQHRLVLECSRTANHVLNARFVHGEMAKRGARIACAHVSAMLGQLERAGRLEVAGDGEWRYPMRGRIIDAMLGDPARAWDMDGILEATGIARRDSGDVDLALGELASDGLIAGLEDGRWGCRAEGVDEQGQRRRRAAALARAAVLSALRQKGAGMDSGRLAELVGGHLSRRFSRNRVSGLKQIARDAASSLAKEGRIGERDGIVRLE